MAVLPTEYAFVTGISINRERKTPVVFISTSDNLLDMLTNQINSYFIHKDRNETVRCVRLCSDDYFVAHKEISKYCIQQLVPALAPTTSIREKLDAFNHKPFQKREGSRASCFEEEKLFLLPLPATPFELAVWKVATVQYNYHISVERMNYSVPYEYIKQQVDVRLTRTTVEIFFSGTRVASHLRLHGRPNQYSTVESHMPPDHQSYLQWNGERFLRWAEQIGQHTAAVVRLFLSAHKVEQQSYKSCMTLLKLADRYSSHRLESACQKALSYTSSPSLKSIQSILKSGQDKLLAEDAPARPEEPKTHKFTRGAGYYTRGE